MNLGYIKNLSSNKIQGIIGHDFLTGNLAYYSYDNELLDCIDIILNRNLFFLINEIKGDNIFIKKEEVTLFDKNYLLAVNYSLPSPWRIVKIENINGDLEEIVQLYSKKIDKGEELI